MVRQIIFYAGQRHRRVVSAEHCVRCTFPFRGMFLLSRRRLRRNSWLRLHTPPRQLAPIAPWVINDSDSPPIRATEHRMGVLTIRSLTLTGNRSDPVRIARLHNEQQLVAAAKCGDAAAFDQLFQPIAKRTFQIVYRITRNREDAEDALQDSLLRAFLHIKAFETRSGFSSWFTSIAINSALMMLRKKRNSFEIHIDGSGNPDAIGRHWEAADRAPNPEKHCLQKERERILRRAIRALRPSIRGVVEMQQLQEHSMKETARMMGITVAAAKARLFQARAALRKNAGLKAIAKTTRNSERN